MGYIKFIDNLPKILKIIFAVFLDILFVVYRFIQEIIDKNWTLLILDIIFAVILSPVFWILNIIWVIVKNQVFSFGEWVK